MAYTTEELIAAVKEASRRHGWRRMSMHDYTQVSGDSMPSVHTIIARLGSWNAACVAAGVQPGLRRRDSLQHEDLASQLADHTPAQVAARHEVGTTRLRQVARQQGVSLSVLREQRRSRNLENARRDLLAQAASPTGTPLSRQRFREVSQKYQITQEESRALLASLRVLTGTIPARPTPQHRRGPRVSRDRLVKALREARDKEPQGHLSTASYHRLRKPGDPGVSSIVSAFGTWNEALEAAGIAHRAPHPGVGRQRLDIDALGIVREYRAHCLTHGQTPAQSDFLSSQPHAKTALNTLARQGVTFADALDEAYRHEVSQ